MRILTGIDLVDISDFEKSYKNGRENFKKRVFHSAEIKNEELGHLAGVFAAIDAVMKALSLKPGSWLQITIRNKKDGRPFVTLTPKTTKKIKFQSCDLSISHTEKVSVAVFVAIL